MLRSLGLSCSSWSSFAAHRAACLAGGSPVMEIGCLPCSHTRRCARATSRGESSGVKVLVGEGLAISPGRSMKRTLQPRYTTCVGTDVRSTVDAEPQRRGRRPELAAKEQPRAAAGSTGVREVARREETRGANWGPSRYHARMRPMGKRPAWTKKISRREGPRGADEATVALTQRDNITRRGAKGLWAGVPDLRRRAPLDRKVLYGKTSSVQLPALDCSGMMTGLALRVRCRGGWCMRVSRLSQVSVPKVAVDFQLEAVLGKTRRTEFSRGSKKRVAWSGGYLPRSSKGRIRRKSLAYPMARLLSTR